MIDRTVEDVGQDRRIAHLEAEVNNLKTALTAAKFAVDALATRLQPLEGLADQLKKIQDFFATLGQKS